MKLKRLSTSTAETAEYEGEYMGRRVRITRLTDPNDDGGRPETRWDGFVWVESTHGWTAQWSLVAECHQRMTDAVYATQAAIKRMEP